MNILTLLGSSRKDGNSDYLVKQALDRVDHTSMHLHDYQMNPIIDERHTEEGFTAVEDDYERVLKEFLNNDIIVFATPLYWFGMSGQMKIFFDRWSQYMRDPRFDFKESVKQKKAYVIITGNSPDPRISALPLVQQFKAIFDYIGMEFSDYIIGQANKPGEIQNDSFAMAKADLWNRQWK
ncbi:flavodoxin family protein [Sediminibacillus halophilus]|uniref:Flavodoxin-like fold n=1 Tax=Sediminibacillus halophilus TaxID=482461 RepID=A0A1G9P2C5_9BACI|nr:flavodoxin family protein [Sediminibacillus halophilus]SDL92693.1 Flavodoxin-like fold [Sediminibacillus halophilus]